MNGKDPSVAQLHELSATGLLALYASGAASHVAMRRLRAAENKTVQRYDAWIAKRRLLAMRRYEARQTKLRRQKIAGGGSKFFRR